MFAYLRISSNKSKFKNYYYKSLFNFFISSFNCSEKRRFLN